MISGITSSTGFAYDRVYLPGGKGQAGQSASASDKTATAGGSNKRTETDNAQKTGELSVEERRQLDKLVATDRKVRAHEMAHVSVGGELVRGGANFDYQTGPDGKRYAVGGEVSIDTSKGRTPEETIPKAQRIRAAALAPADPSPQDNRVAALASRMEMQARQELALQRAQEMSDGNPAPSSGAGSTGSRRNEDALAAYASAARVSGFSAQSSGFRAFA